MVPATEPVACLGDFVGLLNSDLLIAKLKLFGNWIQILLESEFWARLFMIARYC